MLGPLAVKPDINAALRAWWAPEAVKARERLERAGPDLLAACKAALSEKPWGELEPMLRAAIAKAETP